MPYSLNCCLLWMGRVTLGEHKPILHIRESLRTGKYNHRHLSFFCFPARGAFATCKLPHADSRGGLGMDLTWLWDQCVPLWGRCAFPPVSGPIADTGRGSGALVEHPQGKSAAVCGARCRIQHSPRRLRPQQQQQQQLAAGEHSREAGAGPAPRGREKGLLWKRFCIRIKS